MVVHYTRLEWLAWDQHSSLLGLFISYEKISAVNTVLYCATTFSIMTLSIKTFSITTISIMALGPVCFMLNITNGPFVRSVIMLNVVAPRRLLSFTLQHFRNIVCVGNAAIFAVI